MNKLRAVSAPAGGEEKNQTTPPVTVSFRQTVRNWLKLRINGWEIIEKNLVFALFLTGIGLLYIWNTHRAERIARYSDQLQREIRELKSEYMTLHAQMSLNRRQTDMMRIIDSLKLKPMEQPPFRLIDNIGQ
jgi:hypothetical protein